MVLRLQLKIAQTLCHRAANIFVYADRAKYLSNFAFYLSVTATVHASSGRPPSVAIVIPFSLGCQETADAHGDRSRYELPNTTSFESPRGERPVVKANSMVSPSERPVTLSGGQLAYMGKMLRKG